MKKFKENGRCRIDLVCQGRCYNKAVHTRTGHHGELHIELCTKHDKAIGHILGAQLTLQQQG